MVNDVYNCTNQAKSAGKKVQKAHSNLPDNKALNTCGCNKAKQATN
jgi:hypothetical protein